MTMLLIKVTLLCAAALLTLAAMRRASAALRHLVAASTALGVLLLPFSLLAPPSAGIPIGAFRIAAVATPRGTPAAFGYADWLPAIWGIGVFCLLLRLAAGHWRIRFLVRTAQPLSEGVCLADVPVPLAAGVVRPVILLPRSWHEWTGAHQDAALCHEQAHIDRLDLWINFTANLACAFYWFHPLVWLVARQLRQEQETACDDAVLAGGMEPASYAEALTAAARRFTPTSLPGCQMLTHQTLKSRISRLFDTKLPRQAAVSSIRRTAVAAVALLAILGLVRAQENKDARPVPDRVYRANEGGVTAPRVITRVEPAYTDEARDAKIEGTVQLSVIIDVDGKAMDIRIVNSPDDGLANSAVGAVRQWEFAPATLDGQPVPVTATIEVNFKLQ